MVKIISAKATCGKVHVNDMISSWNETDHSSNEKNDTLDALVMKSYPVDSHGEQHSTEDQQRRGHTHRLPILPDLGVVPAVDIFDVAFIHGHIIVNQRIGILGDGILWTFVGPGKETENVDGCVECMG